MNSTCTDSVHSSILLDSQPCSAAMPSARFLLSSVSEACVMGVEGGRRERGEPRSGKGLQATKVPPSSYLVGSAAR